MLYTAMRLSVVGPKSSTAVDDDGLKQSMPGLSGIVIALCVVARQGLYLYIYVYYIYASPCRLSPPPRSSTHAHTQDHLRAIATNKKA